MGDDVIIGYDGKPRCGWAGAGDTAFGRYHDEVWGSRSYDASALFEALTLGVFEAGLASTAASGPPTRPNPRHLPNKRNREMPEHLVGTVEELGPGSVRGIGDWAVLNIDGERYAVSRRCRHLRADLAAGKIDEDGCLVCPWHRSR